MANFTKEKPVVVVAMSGGVDSSVAAALLVEQGYSVIGMMLRLWSERDLEMYNRCCSPDSMSMARRVASILSIPFYVLDARQLFFDTVVKPFIKEYVQNRTPNPCIACNRSIRWDFLLNHALAAGAEFLATGHYAQVAQTSQGTLRLSRGVDNSKDQSYVLHMLTQEKLKHALFPLGKYRKQEVRQMAVNYNLPVAERLDSQDLCFVGVDGDYRQFLIRNAPQSQNPGMIVNQQGIALGRHEGLAFFTIGQRKGLQVSSPVPLYVIDKDGDRNYLIVGSRDESGKEHLLAEQMNWIEGYPPQPPFNASVQIRYKARVIPGVVSYKNKDRIQIEFANRIRNITPGQAAVLYNDDTCLGGGIITNQDH